MIATIRKKQKEDRLSAWGYNDRPFPSVLPYRHFQDSSVQMGHCVNEPQLGNIEVACEKTPEKIMNRTPANPVKKREDLKEY